MYQFIPLQRDYLCETSLKANVVTDGGKDRNETHGLIAQSVKASERNSVVVVSNV